MSFLSGPHYEPSTRKVPSQQQRMVNYYSLMPNVWKLLDPKPKIVPIQDDEEDDGTTASNQNKHPFPFFGSSNHLPENNDIMLPSLEYAELEEFWGPSTSSHDQLQSTPWQHKPEEISQRRQCSPKLQLPLPLGTIRPWCGTKLYSDLVREGLTWISSHQNGLSPSNMMDVIMMYESPCSPTRPTPSNSNRRQRTGATTTFCNNVLFRVHDDDPNSGSNVEGKTILGPLRYASMTGNAFPTFLQNPVPVGLVEHWSKSIPSNPPPIVSHVMPTPSQSICAYLPLERFVHQHMIDPYIHYELCGKDCIPRMTRRTTKVFPWTPLHPKPPLVPCVIKATHAMGSRGIFVIQNEDDYKQCIDLLVQDTAGSQPQQQQYRQHNFVVTEFVRVGRSLAAHFFLHPSGDVTWFGTSENLPLRQHPSDGTTSDTTTICSDDATMVGCPQEQAKLQKLMMPYVRDVATYCLSRGYWGPCGIDVLIDRQSGRGFVVDVNPRVTGTCPALMVFTKLLSSSSSAEKKTVEAVMAASNSGLQSRSKNEANMYEWTTPSLPSSSSNMYQHGIFRRSRKHAYPGTARELLRQVNELNEKSEMNGRNLRVIIFSLYERSPTCTLVNIGVYGSCQDECEQILNHFAPKLLSHLHHRPSHLRP